MVWKSNYKKKYAYLPIIGLFIYFLFWWTYKLDALPGLHGDEAWSGLKAYRFEGTGVTQITGMNNYTGILQTTTALLMFKIFGMGVLQLRISGTIMNLFGMLLLSSYLIKNVGIYAGICFLGIMSQSILYLFLPRVAWEVDTFTLILFASAFVSLVRIYGSPTDNHPIAVTCFLFFNIMGSYNHIIFSCFSISAVASLIAWSFYVRSSAYKNLILLLFINALNIIAIFILMRYGTNIMLAHISLLVPILILLLILEVKIYGFVKKIVIPTKFKIKIPRILISLTLTLIVASFLCIHGQAFFNVITNYKILLIGYSYECAITLKIIFIITGFCFCAYIVKFILLDLQDKHHSVFAFYIIFYCGFLTIYTTGVAFRYYLGLYLIISLYLVLKICKSFKLPIVLISSLLITFCLLNYLQLSIYLPSDRLVKAIRFKWSRSQIGTSEHFLPKEPILKYLSNNRVSEVHYQTSNKYFLEEPILFYEFAKMQPESLGKAAKVAYDFENYGTGFVIKPDK